MKETRCCIVFIEDVVMLSTLPAISKALYHSHASRIASRALADVIGRASTEGKMNPPHNAHFPSISFGQEKQVFLEGIPVCKDI